MSIYIDISIFIIPRLFYYCDQYGTGIIGHDLFSNSLQPFYNYYFSYYSESPFIHYFNNHSTL